MRYFILISLIILNGCGITIKHVIDQDELIKVEPIEVIVTGNADLIIPEFPEITTINITL